MALRLDDVDLVRDRALVERFQAGDEAAFDELYRRYFRRLERFCARRVGDGPEAEEVAQEAMARAYSAMPRLTGDRRFYPWVSVIAARLCVDTHRRRARSQPSDEIDLGSVDGGQERVLDAVDLDLLRRALENLGPRHREVLELREQQGWSYQRIADYYGVTLGTVEALLFRARKALRREFLAIAGPDGGRRGLLIGLPGVAWFARRMGAAKAKLDTLLAPGLAQVAAGGVAVLAISGATVLGGQGMPSAVAQVAGESRAAAVAQAPASAAVAFASASSVLAAAPGTAPVGGAQTSATPAGAQTGTPPVPARDPIPGTHKDVKSVEKAAQQAPTGKATTVPVDYDEPPVTLTGDPVAWLGNAVVNTPSIAASTRPPTISTDRIPTP